MRRFVAAPSVSPPAGQGSGHIHRLPQLASLIQHELGVLLRRELELPLGVLLTVTKVQVVDDLSLARVGVSVLPYAERHAAFKVLTSVRGQLQRTINERLKLYRVPKLEFYIDETPERAATIEGVLDRLNKLEGKPKDTRRLDSLRKEQ